MYNVHSLLHLAANVASFGCLDNFSAFPFESKLYQIKRTVRSGKNPLVQVANCLEENLKVKIPNEQQIIIKEKSVYILSDTM